MPSNHDSLPSSSVMTIRCGASSPISPSNSRRVGTRRPQRTFAPDVPDLIRTYHRERRAVCGVQSGRRRTAAPLPPFDGRRAEIGEWGFAVRQPSYVRRTSSARAAALAATSTASYGFGKVPSPGPAAASLQPWTSIDLSGGFRSLRRSACQRPMSSGVISRRAIDPRSGRRW
jgi:hypothetical protein